MTDKAMGEENQSFKDEANNSSFDEKDLGI